MEHGIACNVESNLCECIRSRKATKERMNVSPCGSRIQEDTRTLTKKKEQINHLTNDLLLLHNRVFGCVNRERERETEKERERKRDRERVCV